MKYQYGSMCSTWNRPKTAFVIDEQSGLARVLALQSVVRKVLEGSSQEGEYRLALYSPRGLVDRKYAKSYDCPRCHFGLMHVDSYDSLKETIHSLETLAKSHRELIFNVEFPGARSVAAVHVERLLAKLPDNVHVWRDHRYMTCGMPIPVPEPSDKDENAEDQGK